jgi:hypothetical protein
MHANLALAAAYGRFIHPPTPPPTKASRGQPPPPPPEVYHMTQCTTLFNLRLSHPIHDHDRDPLWATASFLGLLSLALCDALTPEEAWPLKDPSPSDLGHRRQRQEQRVGTHQPPAGGQYLLPHGADLR